MDEVDYLLIEGFKRVVGGLSREELERRLSRRGRFSLAGPPRAWCIAVRAADYRIVPPLARVDRWRINPETGVRHSHVVELERELIDHLCQPVVLRPYTEHRKAAAALGVDPQTLRAARRKGIFEVKRIKGLCGRRGKLVPCLTAPFALDPNAGNMRQPADPLWGGMWRYTASALGADFRQQVVRRPVFYDHGGRLHYHGLQWECPGCGKMVRTLYFPMPRPTLCRGLGLGAEYEDSHPAPENAATFACAGCHGVRYTTRVDENLWNLFVSYMSDGLLYGREVKKPAWLVATRQRAYRARANARPARRREEVMGMLLKRWSYARIAREMGVGEGAVSRHAGVIYRQHRVKGVEGLAKALGVELPARGRSAPRQAVEEMARRGMEAEEMARGLKVGIAAVCYHLRKLRGGSKGWWRRREVARMIEEGMGVKEIARRLGLSVATVNYHLRRLRCRADGVRAAAVPEGDGL